MIENLKILILEDDQNDADLLQRELKKSGLIYTSEIVQTRKAFDSALESFNPDIILADYSLPSFDGLTAFNIKQNTSPDIPIIIVSGFIGEENAVELIRNGVTDYAPKDKLFVLIPKINRALKEAEEKKEKRIADEELVFQNEEKEKWAAELIIANKKLAFQNQESEEQFEAIFNDAPMGIAIIDSLTGNIFNVNPTFAKIAGRTIAEMANIDWMSITHPDDIQLDLNNMAQLLAGEINGFRMEKRYIHPDGSLVWINMTISKVLHDNKSHPRHLCMIEDITERKRAEEALRESEEKHRTILQTSMYGFWLVDMQGRLLEVNETYCRMSGYSAAELLTLHLSDLEAAQVPAYTAAHIQKIKSQGEDRFESRHRRKDGSIFDIEASVQYQFVKDGRIVVFIQDISERKRTEEALVKLEKAIYTSGEAIFLTDREGVFTFVNPAFSSLYGFSTDELIGKTTPRIINSGVLDKSIYKDFWQTLLNGNEIKGEMINKRKDGTLMNIDGSATPIIDEEKKIIGFLGIQRNITERKRAEEELIEKEFFLRESQRAGNIGSFKTNFVTGYWQSSETLDRIFGIDKNYDRSIAGWVKIIHPDDRQKMDEDLREVIGKRKSFNKEYRIVRINDNQTKWVCGFGDVKFDDSGNISDIIGTIQDITGQKDAELERVMITADLIQRNKDLEQFSYIVSHNLRAPVANIIGFSAIAQDENLESDMKKEVMDGISHSVKKLDDVIIDLNNILQTRQGLSQKMEMVHFSKIAKNIHRSIENLIKKEKAVLVWDFSEVDEMITIKSYLHSIFYNLIFNSLKYRQPGIPPVIVIKSRKLKDKIVLLFKDNGMGIDLEKVGDQVFGLYKRFHTKNSEGKGMGLYMVKTQVETIGGKISISSEVNKGTEFKIEFEI